MGICTKSGAALGISTDGFETSRYFQQIFTEFRINFLKAQQQFIWIFYCQNQHFFYQFQLIFLDFLLKLMGSRTLFLKLMGSVEPIEAMLMQPLQINSKINC